MAAEQQIPIDIHYNKLLGKASWSVVGAWLVMHDFASVSCRLWASRSFLALNAEVPSEVIVNRRKLTSLLVLSGDVYAPKKNVAARYALTISE